MKKIISIILCLAMVFAMAATAFAATALCSFSVEKIDKETGEPLANAEFVLIPEGTTEPAYFACSDTDGVAVFTDVIDGTYILKENIAPAGYIKSDAEYTVYVNGGRAISGYHGDDAGNIVPIPYSTVVFENEKENTIIDPITVYIPITKIVEKTGAKDPKAETFNFEIYGFQVEGNVTVISSTVETNGVGSYEENLVIEVETEDIVLEPFYIKETKGNSDGWTYSDAVYMVIPVFNDDGSWSETFEFEIEENGDPVTYDKAVFVNSYYENFNFAPANPAPSNPDPIIIDTTEEANPNTGAPVLFAPAVIAAVAAVAIIRKRK